MIVNMKAVLKYAEENNCAIGAYNTPNLETLTAVISAAESLGVPVIIMHAQVHETVVALDAIAPLMVAAAKAAKIPVCVHLDHGEDAEYLTRAMKLGFTSVMYDGSNLPYDENAANTRLIVKLAKGFDASVEAEIGSLGHGEGESGGGANEDLYTDPQTAKKFSAETGIDALACSFGTAHGFYTSAPKLDFDRIAEIRALTGLPLVMHGGSGVAADDYVKTIGIGIRKINYYSYMALAGVNGVKAALESGDVRYFHDLANAAAAAMREDAVKSMTVFYGKRA